MKFIVRPSIISGNITPPPSKSHTLRALLFALMGEGKTTIYNYLHSADSAAMIQAIQHFGGKVQTFPHKLEIIGVGPRPPFAEDVIDAGNSGLVLRLIGAMAALIPSYTVITGDISIRHNRPIQPLLSALSQLDVFATSSRLDGYAPIIIKGPLHGGRAQLEGNDSQPVSALLIASSFSTKSTELFVHSPGERPWIDLTLQWLNFLGIPYRRSNYEYYYIYGNSHYKGFQYTIPSDCSSMAFPLAAALITHSAITIDNIDPTDVQGDKKIIHTLSHMGATLFAKNSSLHVKRGGLYGKRFDVNDYVDALPILAVIGCFAEGKTEIYNGAIARKKESDRIHAITNELKKMEAAIEEREDGLIVHHSKLKGAHLESHYDHRIAMSLTVAALGAEGQSSINGVECIQKTYPTFAMDMQRLGAKIEVIS